MSERRVEIDRRWGLRLKARTYQKGRMRAVTLREGPPRAAHLDPELPRAVMRWSGKKTGWKLVKVVPNLAAAQEFMRPKDTKKPKLEPW
ncbi:DUF6087 family protein [Streptomyces sp. NPDC059003]|uniref:DUF6087 family protein n=1 Tax=Streptomyces sp. NPDC059003 TaxID=3346691 RepID=UPI0036C7C52F